jgi:S-(hydroxymethyl)glutathione dehydrogenase/alcohol dehydrogenase
LIQGCRLASAYPIVGIDINEDKRSKVESLGANYIDISQENLKLRLNKFGLNDLDVIIDTTGNKNVIESTIQYLSENGRYVMIGQLKPGENLNIPNVNSFFNGNGQTLKATQGGKTIPNKDIPKYIKLHEAGILNIDNIITHRFNLENINEAISLLRSGSAGRIMIKMQ